MKVSIFEIFSFILVAAPPWSPDSGGGAAMVAGFRWRRRRGPGQPLGLTGGGGPHVRVWGMVKGEV